MLEQLIGMEKQAAIDLLHGKGMIVRIAEEDGITNNLTDNYVPNRVDLVLKFGKVKSFTQG
jgi:hypothetical protein